MAKKDRSQLIIQRLAKAGREDPDLSSFYDFHQTVFQMLNETQTSIVGTLEIADQETLEAWVLQGLPLLSFAQLPIEAERFAESATSLAHELLDYEPELKGQSLPADVTNWVSLAERRFTEGQATSQGSDDAAAVTLAQLAADLALKPYLEWAAEQVLSHVDQERWKRRYCPVCGGSPDFAFLADKSGTRYLLCSRCNSQWLFQRLGCPFCSTDDHTKISHYPSDDGVYRLYVCDACQRYLKTMDLRNSRRRMLVEVERAITVDMDVVARQEGYR